MESKIIALCPELLISVDSAAKKNKLGPQCNSEILIRGRSAGSDPQPNVAFHLLENEFENVELTHGTRLGMDGKALG